MRLVRNIHIPRTFKKVPIPKAVKTTAEIKKYVEPTEIPRPLKPTKYVTSMMPETVDAATLVKKSATDSPVWYNVERTRAGNIPVYTDYNNAGGVWTEVRKIQGNVGALRNDLKVALGLAKKDIWVQDASKRIFVKGNHSQKIKKILASSF